MIVRTSRRTLSMFLAGGALVYLGHPLNAQEKSAQIEYVERGRPVTPGQAPGMKVKDLGSSARMFEVTFTKGDEVMSGLTDFAAKNNIKAAHFTAIGATTRQGLVSAPLRGRFGLVLRLNHYGVAELTAIVLRSAKLLGVTVDDEGAEEIARRSRGTPRIANRLLRRVRDYAQVRAAGHIDLPVATSALDLLEVDRFGLDEIDQKIMLTLLEKYSGGPVGVNTIAASIDEEADTIEKVYEPYLMQLGFIDRTPRGRVGTDRAFDYFQIPRKMRGSVQSQLF